MKISIIGSQCHTMRFTNYQGLFINERKMAGNQFSDFRPVGAAFYIWLTSLRSIRLIFSPIVSRLVLLKWIFTL